MADEEHAHEIIIIKHHGDHEEGHHGGAWKIAFADFMTAMMAFFLVMWLMSANDKTKATIAEYFNPVKLVDTTPQPKGIEDAKAVENLAPSKTGAKKPTPPSAAPPAPPAPKAEPSKEEPAPESAAAGGAEGAKKAKEKRLAAAVLDDPFAALSEIAGNKGSGEKSLAAANPKPVPKAVSSKGGEAFRDPFAPPPPLQADVTATPTEMPEADAKLFPPGGDPNVLDAASGREGTTGKAEGVVAETVQGPPGPMPKAATPAMPQPDAAAAAKPAKADTAAPAPETQSAALKAQITAAAKGAGLDKDGPQVDVRKVEGGLLISLTDAENFEMFSSGSALPGKKVVLMMDRIGQVLKARPGSIVVRGFTDNRPFKAGKYDNWHLSLDRAQVTHYMLVRGGVDEARISHIEGYADRNLKDTAAPASAVNRRIEILLKSETP